MTNLYEVLGVKADATPEELHKAFRAASKKAHPDVNGGDDTAFRALKAAYDVLKDPDKRAYYDEHAEIPQDALSAADLERRDDLTFLTNLIRAVIIEGNVFERNPSVDLKKVMIEEIDVKVGEVNNVVFELRVREKRIRHMTKRFKRKSQDKGDFINGILLQQLDRVRNKIRQVRADLAMLARVRAIVEDYEYTAHKPTPAKAAQLRLGKPTIKNREQPEDQARAFIDQMFREAMGGQAGVDAAVEAARREAARRGGRR